VKEASNGKILVSAAFQYECSHTEQVRHARDARPLANLIAVGAHSKLHGVSDPSGHWHRTALDLETLSAFLSVVMVLIPP
jgi:hypothetical protein